MANELEQIEKEIQEKKEQTKYLPEKLAHNEIHAQYDKNKEQLLANDDFKNLTQQIIERSAKAELTKDMLAILSEEQKNELSAYLLQCEKQKLDYRKKKEKKVVLEEVKAEVAEKKINALKRRYGYLYKLDENGQPKDFIANKFVNKYKELINWWDGTSDGFKKIVKGILKVVLWGGIAALIILLGYRAFKWIAENTKNIPNI